MMHSQVLHWVGTSLNEWGLARHGLRVLEFGSLDINGSVRSIIEPISAQYVGVDMQSGPGVDVISDAASYRTSDRFDVVVCCEVFEHTPQWRQIIDNSYDHLVNGGLFVATMAGEGRRPHSAIDEQDIRDWEYYANVGAWELRRSLARFSKSSVDYHGFDLRCWAVK